MDGNIFDSKKERELQALRQRQASNRIIIDPNLRGFTQRFDPSYSRARLLRLQRERLPTRAELERDIGVKTVKKLKKERGKIFVEKLQEILENKEDLKEANDATDPNKNQE